MQSYEHDDLTGVKVVATDMDCTLLADDKSLPPHMDTRIEALGAAGVTFAAASGRPLYTLQELFGPHRHEMAFISDNGAAVVCRGDVVFKSLLAPEALAELVDATLALPGLVPVVCGLESAYVPSWAAAHDTVLREFYRKIAYVDAPKDLLAEANKFTVYLPEGTSARVCEETFAPRFGGRFSVTCAGATWIDVMNPGVNKDTGLARLCTHLGVGLTDAAAFGDTDNDVEMLEAAGHSYLMANAEARMRPHARFLAPSNNERGVAVVLDRLLATLAPHS